MPRVSTGEQNLDRQVAQLKAEKVFTYFTDKRSGDHGNVRGWMRRCVMSARVIS